MGAISLNQAIKDVKEYWDSNRDRPDDWEDNDDWSDDDAVDYLMDECGDTGDGCTMAGTEYCDWECPFSN